MSSLLVPSQCIVCFISSSFIMKVLTASSLLLLLSVPCPPFFCFRSYSGLFLP